MPLFTERFGTCMRPISRSRSGAIHSFHRKSLYASMPAIENSSSGWPSQCPIVRWGGKWISASRPSMSMSTSRSLPLNTAGRISS